MISRRFIVMACFILPFLLNNCSFLSEDIDAEGEMIDTSERDISSEELEKLPTELTDSEEDAIENSVLGDDSQIQIGEMPLDELNLEVRKLKAELEHYNANVRELRAKSQIWGNPFSVYNKEIILSNGSSVYGKILFQDRDVVKVETLIGKLIIDRSTIVRVIENVIEGEEGDESNGGGSLSPDQIEVVEVLDGGDESGINIIERRKQNQTAQLILMGSIQEKKDKSGNTILSGEVKNVGAQRADFAKINVTFRKNWHGDTETLTAFTRGTYYTFKTGITSDSSILPGAVAEFELVVPKSTGAFIGYSYTLDWEQYD
ncbi:MAG: hypothetical protein H8E72_07885 [Candidatus Marinimicrobia bacterium]|nr:hypothetical protein [Candidatus Neomarinimicrobiota bacterium]